MSTENHVAEDILELYAMKRLQAAEVEALEEHLLVCERCQECLLECERYVRAVRIAAARTVDPEAQQKEAGWRKRLAQAGLSGPKQARVMSAAWAFACCAVIAGIVTLPRSARESDGRGYHEIQLQATRGAEDEAASSNAIRVLLNLDVSGVGESRTYVLTIVDLDGALVWRREVAADQAESGRLRVPVDQKLKTGEFWVRLSSPEPELRILREYPLRVQ